MSLQFDRAAKFNLEILGIQNRVKRLQDEDEFKLSHKQLCEEANEFVGACLDGDYIGAVDACVDSIVFALGILYKLGVSSEEFDKIFDIVMDCNMKKKIGVKKGRGGFNAPDAVKPESWVSPEEAIAKVLSGTRHE